MNVSMLAIGTELLMGTTVNTNSGKLSEMINELGINVLYHFTVGDNPNRIKESLEYLLEKSDIVITTGGLGPTQDDITRDMVAKVSNKELVLKKEVEETIEGLFKSINKTMNENNIKQACFPEDSLILENKNGTAPGFITEFNGKIVISLPGPPHEMEPMFKESVRPYLTKKSKCKMVSKYLTFFGIGESAAESEIDDLVTAQTNPTIATYAKPGQVTIRVTAKAASEDKASDLIKPTVDAIKNRIGSYLISENHESLGEVVSRQLIENHMSISLAESCTGGLIASELTRFSGVSSVFDRSYITYSNQSKMDVLNVKQAILDKYGAVSEETAREMAIGLYLNTKSDICVAVTGIAGPNGGTEDKPVGLVYIGVKYKEEVYVTKNNFRGNRSRVRHYTCLKALNMVRKAINNDLKI